MTIETVCRARRTDYWYMEAVPQRQIDGAMSGKKVTGGDARQNRVDAPRNAVISI